MHVISDSSSADDVHRVQVLGLGGKLGRRVMGKFLWICFEDGVGVQVPPLGYGQNCIDEAWNYRNYRQCGVWYGLDGMMEYGLPHLDDYLLAQYLYCNVLRMYSTSISLDQ